MSRGFYTLASGMLTQQRRVDVSSNNISNINTAGYKKEQAITSNFGNLFINKVEQNGINKKMTPIKNVSGIRIIEENNTIHSQGSLEETNNITDFAIMGEGFFGINSGGNMLYTRNGSFNIDQEGYLNLGNIGRVQGEYGDILIGGDKFTFIEDGTIMVEGEAVDKILLYDFVDYNNLNKAGEGMFITTEDSNIVEQSTIVNKTIERSNVNITQELTGLMESQRALQTASQAIKMYDLIQEKAVNEIGKIN